MSEHITPDTMKLNGIEFEGFCGEPRSLFYEVTRLRPINGEDVTPARIV